MTPTTFPIRRGRGLIALATIAVGLTAAGPGGSSADAATTGPATTSPASASPIKVNKLNWSGDAHFGSRAPAWYKDRSGVVHLQGALTQTNPAGPGASTLGTLPPAARPGSNVFTIVHTFNGTYADLGITRGGQLDLIAPRPPAVTDYTFVSLEGITYRPSGRVGHITLNSVNWSAKAHFGSRGPAWFKDRSGVVHLQGAFATKGRKCTQFCPVGTLPSSVAPNRALTIITHTFNGTYAGISISTSGQIFIIGPGAPAVPDYTFVSLEGITYRPSGHINAIKLNKTNWATAPGFGRRTPGWFIDSSGVVHLQGTLIQTKASSTETNLGTLPPAARPSRNVFTILLTDAGTYADLEVARNGRLNLIAARSPLMTNFGLALLEGITYRR